jgi:hypothetical protein
VEASLLFRCMASGIGLILVGCSATCLRDSDCIGDSVCFQDRCVLIAALDAGGVPTPPPVDPSPTTPTPEAPPGTDAGASGAASNIGGDATPTRGNLDATSDAAPTVPGP